MDTLTGDYQHRLNWLDSTKVIGIILVYIGHCNIPDVNPYIYLFHMPLFFIISGFCWNTDKNANMPFRNFAEKKFNRYIIPYFKICTVCFIVFTVIMGYNRYGVSHEWGRDMAIKLFAILIYSRGTTDWLPNCSPVWFLTCLFYAEILFYYIMKRNRPYLYVILAGFIGYAMSQVGKFFPWNIDNAFSAIPLIYIGVIIKKYWSRLSNMKYLLFLLPISAAIVMFGIKGVDFDGNRYKNMLAMYLQSIIISYTLLLLCSVVFKTGWKFLPQFGRNTIILFGYNYAINTLLLSFVPFVASTWIMAFLVVVMGGMIVVIANKFPILKRVLV